MMDKNTTNIDLKSTLPSSDLEKPAQLLNSRSKSLTTGTSSDAKVQNEKSAQPFDPHNFGKEDGISTLGACVHIIRCTIGSGILMMPFAFKNLGIIPGTVLLVIVGIIYYHSVHTLVSIEYQLCKSLEIRSLSFIGVTEKSFQRAPYPINKFGPFVCYVSYFYFSIPTSPATYLIVISTNIQHLAEFYDTQVNTTYVIIAVTIPFILFCLVRRMLKILVPFSSIANGCTFLMAGVLIVTSIVYRKSDVSVRLFGDVNFIPKGFAMFLLSIRSTGIVLPVKNDMEQPKRFSQLFGTLNIAGTAIVSLYYIFALICYVDYGAEAQENILFNLPKKNIISFSIYLLYTLALSITYILAFFICFNCFWSSQLEAYIEDGLYKTILENIIRIGINVVAFFMAIGVPQISLIAAMAGTLGILVEIALPPTLQLLLMINEKQRNCFVILKNVFIIVISAALFSLSTARCVSDMLALYGY